VTAIPTTTGAAWMAAVLDDFDLTEQQRATLQLAAEALDRARQAQAAMDADGIVVAGLHGPKAHPAVAIRRDACQEFLRLANALGLNDHRADAPDTLEHSGGLLD
jgi:phage terminase small subunit